MALITGIIILILAALFSIEALILREVSKFFKLPNVTYKNSLIILLGTALVSATTYLVLNDGVELSGSLALRITAALIALATTLLAFHYLLRRYYQANWKKTLSVYVIYTCATLIISLLLIVPIRFFVVEPFYVKGASMEPTYNANDYLLTNKLDRNITRNDIIVFHYPATEKRFLIKRVIGLPGEHVTIKNDTITISTPQNPQGFIIDERSYLKPATHTKDIDVELGADEYFVLGDNREASLDSTTFGSITTSSIVGKVFFKLANFTNTTSLDQIGQ